MDIFSGCNYNTNTANTNYPTWENNHNQMYWGTSPSLWSPVSTTPLWSPISEPGIYVNDFGTTSTPPATETHVEEPVKSVETSVPDKAQSADEPEPTRPRLVAGDTVYTKFLRGAKGPFVLIQPTSMMLDEDTGCKSGKLQRVAVQDAWTVQDAEGKTFAFPAALLTRVPPMPKDTLWRRITSPQGLEIINMSLLAILSALTSGCLSAGIYMLANS